MKSNLIKLKNIFFHIDNKFTLTDQRFMVLNKPHSCPVFYVFNSSFSLQLAAVFVIVKRNTQTIFFIVQVLRNHHFGVKLTLI